MKCSRWIIFRGGLLPFLKPLHVFVSKLDPNRTPKSSLSSHFLAPSSGLLCSLTSWCGGLTRWGVCFLCIWDHFRTSRWKEREQCHSGIFIWWITAAVIHQNSRNFVLLGPKREFSISFFLIWQRLILFLRASKGICAPVKGKVPSRFILILPFHWWMFQCRT